MTTTAGTDKFVSFDDPASKKREETVNFCGTNQIFTYDTSKDLQEVSSASEDSVSHHVTDTGISITRGTTTETLTSIERQRPGTIGGILTTGFISETEEGECTDAGLSPIQADELTIQDLDEVTHYTETGTSPIEFHETTSDAGTLTDQVDTKDASSSPIKLDDSPPLSATEMLKDEEILSKRRGSGDVKAKIKLLEEQASKGGYKEFKRRKRDALDSEDEISSMKEEEVMHGSTETLAQIDDDEYRLESITEQIVQERVHDTSLESFSEQKAVAIATPPKHVGRKIAELQKIFSVECHEPDSPKTVPKKTDDAESKPVTKTDIHSPDEDVDIIEKLRSVKDKRNMFEELISRSQEGTPTKKSKRDKQPTVAKEYTDEELKSCLESIEDQIVVEEDKPPKPDKADKPCNIDFNPDEPKVPCNEPVCIKVHVEHKIPTQSEADEPKNVPEQQADIDEPVEIIKEAIVAHATLVSTIALPAEVVTSDQVSKLIDGTKRVTPKLSPRKTPPQMLNIGNAEMKIPITESEVQKIMSEVLEASKQIKQGVKELKPDLTPTPEGQLLQVVTPTSGEKAKDLEKIDEELKGFDQASLAKYNKEMMNLRESVSKTARKNEESKKISSKIDADGRIAMAKKISDKQQEIDENRSESDKDRFDFEEDERSQQSFSTMGQVKVDEEVKQKQDDYSAPITKLKETLIGKQEIKSLAEEKGIISPQIPTNKPIITDHIIKSSVDKSKHLSPVEIEIQKDYIGEKIENKIIPVTKLSFVQTDIKFSNSKRISAAQEITKLNPIEAEKREIKYPAEEKKSVSLIIPLGKEKLEDHKMKSLVHKPKDLCPVEKVREKDDIGNEIIPASKLSPVEKDVKLDSYEIKFPTQEDTKLSKIQVENYQIKALAAEEITTNPLIPLDKERLEHQIKSTVDEPKEMGPVDKVAGQKDVKSKIVEEIISVSTKKDLVFDEHKIKSPIQEVTKLRPMEVEKQKIKSLSDGKVVMSPIIPLDKEKIHEHKLKSPVGEPKKLSPVEKVAGQDVKSKIVEEIISVPAERDLKFEEHKIKSPIEEVTQLSAIHVEKQDIKALTEEKVISPLIPEDKEKMYDDKLKSPVDEPKEFSPVEKAAGQEDVKSTKLRAIHVEKQDIKALTDEKVITPLIPEDKEKIHDHKLKSPVDEPKELVPVEKADGQEYVKSKIVEEIISVPSEKDLKFEEHKIKSPIQEVAKLSLINVEKQDIKTLTQEKVTSPLIAENKEKMYNHRITSPMDEHKELSAFEKVAGQEDIKSKIVEEIISVPAEKDLKFEEHKIKSAIPEVIKLSPIHVEKQDTSAPSEVKALSPLIPEDKEKILDHKPKSPVDQPKELSPVEIIAEQEDVKSHIVEEIISVPAEKDLKFEEHKIKSPIQEITKLSPIHVEKQDISAPTEEKALSPLIPEDKEKIHDRKPKSEVDQPKGLSPVEIVDGQEGVKSKIVEEIISVPAEKVLKFDEYKIESPIQEVTKLRKTDISTPTEQKAISPLIPEDKEKIHEHKAKSRVDQPKELSPVEIVAGQEDVKIKIVEETISVPPEKDLKFEEHKIKSPIQEVTKLSPIHVEKQDISAPTEEKALSPLIPEDKEKIHDHKPKSPVDQPKELSPFEIIAGQEAVKSKIVKEIISVPADKDLKFEEHKIKSPIQEVAKLSPIHVEKQDIKAPIEEKVLSAVIPQGIAKIHYHKPKSPVDQPKELSPVDIVAGQEYIKSNIVEEIISVPAEKDLKFEEHKIKSSIPEVIKLSPIHVEKQDISAPSEVKALSQLIPEDKEKILDHKPKSPVDQPKELSTVEIIAGQEDVKSHNVEEIISVPAEKDLKFEEHKIKSPIQEVTKLSPIHVEKQDIKAPTEEKVVSPVIPEDKEKVHDHKQKSQVDQPKELSPVEIVAGQEDVKSKIVKEIIAVPAEKDLKFEEHKIKSLNQEVTKLSPIHVEKQDIKAPTEENVLSPLIPEDKEKIHDHKPKSPVDQNKELTPVEIVAGQEDVKIKIVEENISVPAEKDLKFEEHKVKSPIQEVTKLSPIHVEKQDIKAPTEEKILSPVIPEDKEKIHDHKPKSQMDQPKELSAVEKVAGQEDVKSKIVKEIISVPAEKDLKFEEHKMKSPIQEVTKLSPIHVEKEDIKAPTEEKVLSPVIPEDKEKIHDHKPKSQVDQPKELSPVEIVAGQEDVKSKIVKEIISVPAEKDLKFEEHKIKSPIQEVTKLSPIHVEKQDIKAPTEEKVLSPVIPEDKKKIHDHKPKSQMDQPKELSAVEKVAGQEDVKSKMLKEVISVPAEKDLKFEDHNIKSPIQEVTNLRPIYVGKQDISAPTEEKALSPLIPEDKEKIHDHKLKSPMDQPKELSPGEIVAGQEDVKTKIVEEIISVPAEKDLKFEEHKIKSPIQEVTKLSPIHVEKQDIKTITEEKVLSPLIPEDKEKIHDHKLKSPIILKN
ncbi:titin-like [Cylas formicarius]|uniref:titin-like n=1 Tax=Cylas formicarius TaxID=197179 RepID=UPI002958AF12|nr:titin-like [Cylas formicarius]